MTYSDAGTLSPETQSAIEQEIRILLRVIFFWAWFFFLFCFVILQNVPTYFKNGNMVGGS